MTERLITEGEAEILALMKAGAPDLTLDWGYDETGKWCVMSYDDPILCTGPALTTDELLLLEGD